MIIQLNVAGTLCYHSWIMKRLFNEKNDLLYTLLILAVVVFSYANSVHNTFVWDDKYLVVRNPEIRSLSNIPRLFESGYWASKGHSGGLYRPLTMLSFAVEYSVAGLNHILFHIDNIALHLLCSILVYLIFGSIMKDRRAALFAALLFAAHPVHVEAVSWVSGRAELLAAAFAFLTALIFIKRPHGARYVLLSCLVFLLALLSKESAVTMPVLLGLYLLLFEKPAPGQSRVRQLAVRLYPFAITFILYLVPRVVVLGGSIGPTPVEWIFINVSPYYRFLTMCQALYEYIRIGFLPFSLNADYIFPPPASLIGFKVLLPIALTAAVLVFAKRIFAFSKPALFGILWFYIALLPVSNIIPVALIMSERAMYIPSAGVCMLLGLAISKAGDVAVLPAVRRASIAAPLLVMVLAAFVVGSIDRNPFWKDQDDFEMAQIKEAKKCIGFFPNYAPYYLMLAGLYIEHGRYGEETERALKDAVRLDPDSVPGHTCLAELYYDRGRDEDALAEDVIALSIKPTPDAYNLAGRLLHELGRDGEAKEMLDTGIRFFPDFGELYFNRWYLTHDDGDADKAFELLRSKTEFNSEDSRSFMMQGIILGARKQYCEAIEKLARSEELKPGDPEVHFFLAVAYLGARLHDKAKAEAQAALSIRPDYPEARALLRDLE